MSSNIRVILPQHLRTLAHVGSEVTIEVEGQPTLLVHDGQLLTAHLTKEHVSMDELERSLREHGINNYHDVALAVLEVDGSISCLKYDELNPSANNHLVRRKYLQKH